MSSMCAMQIIIQRTLLGRSSPDIGCCWLGHSTKSRLCAPYQGGPLDDPAWVICVKNEPFRVHTIEGCSSSARLTDALCISVTAGQLTVIKVAVSLVFLFEADDLCVCRIGPHILPLGSLAS